MKIVFLGNIGVGKSSLIEAVKKEYAFAEVTSIDGVRCAHGDGSVEKELLCKKIFINSVKADNSFQIFELSGVGILGEKLFEKLNENDCPVLIVYLYASLNSIHERIKNRKWETPVPFVADKVGDAIQAIQDDYDNGLLYALTKQVRNAVYIMLNNEEGMFERNRKLIIKMIEHILM